MSNEGKMTWGNRIFRWLLFYVLIATMIPLGIEYVTRVMQELSLSFFMWPSISLGGAGWCIMTINDIVNLDAKDYLSTSDVLGKIIIFLSVLILFEGLLIMGLLVRPQGLIEATNVFSKANICISAVVIIASIFVQCFMIITAKKKRRVM